MRLDFGSQPHINCTSFVAFYDFGFREEQIANWGKYMTFHDFLLHAVDDPGKVRKEKEVFDCRVSLQNFLTGLETQLDMLSDVTAALITEVGRMSPTCSISFAKYPILQQYFRAARKKRDIDFETLAKNLANLRSFKNKRRKEQELVRELLSL